MKKTVTIIIIGFILIAFASLLLISHKYPLQSSGTEQAITTSTTTVITQKTSTMRAAQSTTESDLPKTQRIFVHGKEFKAEIADTEALQEHGLSDRVSLPEDRVMLFTFSQAWPWEIWMKDMHFPLDIFWLDQNMKVIYQRQNVSPTTYPATFKPQDPAWYVLEANAGFAVQNEVTTGTSFVLSN